MSSVDFPVDRPPWSPAAPGAWLGQPAAGDLRPAPAGQPRPGRVPDGGLAGGGADRAALARRAVRADPADRLGPGDGPPRPLDGPGAAGWPGDAWRDRGAAGAAGDRLAAGLDGAAGAGTDRDGADPVPDRAALGPDRVPADGPLRLEQRCHGGLDGAAGGPVYQPWLGQPGVRGGRPDTALDCDH